MALGIVTESTIYLVIDEEPRFSRDFFNMSRMDSYEHWYCNYEYDPCNNLVYLTAIGATCVPVVMIEMIPVEQTRNHVLLVLPPSE